MVVNMKMLHHSEAARKTNAEAFKLAPLFSHRYLQELIIKELKRFPRGHVLRSIDNIEAIPWKPLTTFWDTDDDNAFIRGLSRSVDDEVKYFACVVRKTKMINNVKIRREWYDNVAVKLKMAWKGKRLITI